MCRWTFPGLPDLGPSSELRGRGGSFTGHCNAHVHLPPNFSAFETVQQAVDLAAQQCLALLGASNYYDYAAYEPFARAAVARGVFPLFGIEILSMQADLRDAGIKVNDPGNPGKTYLCGKGIRPGDFTDQARRVLDRIRQGDRRRMAQMTARLARIMAEHGIATGLDHEAIVDRVVKRHGSPRESVHLQERHLAQAFQEVLFEKVAGPRRGEVLQRLLGRAVDSENAVAVQNELRNQLMKAGKPAFVDEAYVDFAEAVTLVRELGGIPCYPVLADATSPLCGFEASPEGLIDHLRHKQIPAAEFIAVRNSPEVLARYVLPMRESGLVLTAGTEHNTLELLALKPSCVKGAAIPDPVDAIFREGACVAAAHQYLTLRGEMGYGGDPATIPDLADLGAAVIAACQARARGGVSP